MSLFRLKYLVQIFSFFFLVACNSDKKNTPSTNSRVTAEVYYRLLEQTKAVRAEVSFFNSDSSTPSPIAWDNVVFENRPMKKREISNSQTRYHIDLQNENLRDQNQIRFWNKNASPGEIDIAPNKVNSFRLSGSPDGAPNKISKQSDCFLTADLSASSFNGQATLLFTDKKNQTSKIRVNSSDLSKPIQLLPREVAGIPIGDCSVELILTKIEIIKKEGLAGKIITEFYSKPIDVSVTP